VPSPIHSLPIQPADVAQLIDRKLVWLIEPSILRFRAGSIMIRPIPFASSLRPC
jgi:hypothetical protein